MKQFYLLLLALLQVVPIWAQDAPTASPSIKTFALQPDVNGAVANSVNLFTGDLALPLNLISLPGHNGLDVNVSISYSSNVQQQVNTWNLEAPTGILGLGWSMDMPRIVTDYKQTGAREDDEFYLVEGGTSNRLIRTTNGYDAGGGFYEYETKQYQFWKIKYYYDSNEILNSTGYSSGPNKWEIIKEDGTRYIYGDKNSGRKTIQYVVRWNNWIGNSAQTADQSQLSYIWNLSEIVNVWNQKITFEYENVEQFVGSSAGKKHTEASYLKRITDVLGRQVVFHYKDKVSFVFNNQISPFYIEPHTEQAEPDAYQEVYEKNFLDKIEVLREDNTNFLIVQLGYSAINAGTNTAKMLLSSVVQKNSTGQALPGMQFVYNTTGATKGFLQKITYPTGGTVTYSYKTSGNSIGKSNRQLTINAPAGYAEPKTWMGDDYVVVAWRELGTSSSHDSNAKTVKLYVYQWVGEWKEQFLQTINGVRLEGDTYHLDYSNFQVVTQNKFFAVLTSTTDGNSTLFIRYKSEHMRGHWEYYSSYSKPYGQGVPTLLSGTNFITVGAYRDETPYTSHLYTFQGNSWKEDVHNQTVGDHYYTSANNYFISHNRAGFDGQPEINFSYLTEDKKWVTKKWSSYLLFSSSDRSYWHGSNSFAVCMAYGPPEIAYRWDLTYTNFFKDTKDVNNNDLFGSYHDASPVYMLNNTMVAIYGRLARFDGKYWRTAQIVSHQTDIYFNYFTYGEDLAVRPTEKVTSTNSFKGGRKTFNPNQLQWLPDFIHDGADRGKEIPNSGIDYYYFGNGYYYRQPNGSWVKKLTSTNNFTRAIGGYPRMDVWSNGYPYPVSELRFVKNGEVSNPVTIGSMNLLYNYVKFKSPGVGNQTLVAFPSSYGAPENARSLTLYRTVDDVVSGDQLDYPVSLITVNDGTTNRYTTFDYNFLTAAVDPSGTIAQYNEVTVIPGSSVASSRPYGYTKTFFYNGLTSTELSLPYMAVDLRWTGTPYETKVYSSTNELVSSSKTTFTTFSKEIKNIDGTKVEIGYYVRPTQSNNMTDGIETMAVQYYDVNTGLLKESSSYDYDSKRGNSTYGSTNQTITRYKYFWEQYDPTRTKNMLSPVIQTKQSVFNTAGEVVVGVSAVTWKTWNGISAPYKTYQWKRTGTADFDFTSWSDAGEPSADWMKASQVDEYDAKGNAVQVTVR